MTESDPCIRLADRVDALRIIPRFLVIFYYAFFARFSFYLADWFMAYDFATIQNQAVALAIAGFPVGILGVMTGVLATLSNNYFRTGRSAGPPDNGG
jgi:hypothetical protein